ncbi:hypothetical protein P0L94_15780 [Microbacter sp. GSS18]|nr:hypothetical protein P0L94_15780 [Microbacter sp. GSS18]
MTREADFDALGYVVAHGLRGEEALEAARIIDDGGCVLFAPREWAIDNLGQFRDNGPAATSVGPTP